MKSTKQLLALLIIGLLFVSCDKDYNTIGEGLVNETHFNQKIDSDTEIKTTQYVFGEGSLNPLLDPNPVQTDNLSYNTLGYYNHPVYGGTATNILSQVTLSEYGKDFGTNPVISRVVLSVPYFSRSTDADAGTYELDSVYGSTAINLKMYRSNYFLNDFDENGDAQHYYSNGENNVGVPLPGIESVLLYENSDFIPQPIEVDGEEVDGENEKLSPRLRDDSSDAVNLTNIIDIANFNWLVDPANETNLSSASNFKDFYRGIYFKAEAVNVNSGVLLGLNLSQAEIQIFYNHDDPEGGVDPLESSVKMLFSGTKVNTFENNFNYTDIPGSCYLNGGQGAMVSVELFAGVDSDGNGTSDKLDDLRVRDVLINEAILEFYVDQSTPIGGENEPDRIFLFDLENNKVLLDYQFDNTSESDTNLTQLSHLGKLERDASGFGVKYKLRITEHVTDLIRNDSTNVKLGLAVTNNVLALGSSKLKTPIVIGGDDEDPANSGSDDIKVIFSSSVNSHRGTVLYSENAVDENKKIKLTIYYTEDNSSGI